MDDVMTAQADVTAHDERRCPTGYGCLCLCVGCVTHHCGPMDRGAAWFCVTQGIAPVNSAVRAARLTLDQSHQPTCSSTGEVMSQPVDTDRARMQRQAVLSRTAVLDDIGLPRFCQRSSKTKVMFATRAFAETAAVELERIGDSDPQRAYPCRGHYHLTSTRTPGRPPGQRDPTPVVVGDVVCVPAGISAAFPHRHRVRVDGVGPRLLTGLFIDGAGNPVVGRKQRPRRCEMPLTLLRHCSVERSEPPPKPH
jgi:DNA-directed RNA polymerase subunit N (RpoN/RPB10)